KTNVGHENPCLNIDAVQSVDVISAVRFGEVAIRVVEVPLTSSGARVVTRCSLRVHSELGHQPSHHILVEEIAAYPELGDLKLDVPEHLARARNRVVFGVAEAVVVDAVEPELSRERLGREERSLGGPVARWRP